MRQLAACSSQTRNAIHSQHCGHAADARCLRLPWVSVRVHIHAALAQQLLLRAGLCRRVGVVALRRCARGQGVGGGARSDREALLRHRSRCALRVRARAQCLGPLTMPLPLLGTRWTPDRLP